MFIFFIPFILLVILIAICAKSKKQAEQCEIYTEVTLKHQKPGNAGSLRQIRSYCDPDDYFRTSYKVYESGMDSNSLATVKNKISVLEEHRALAEQSGNMTTASSIQHDIKDLKEHLEELELEKWEDRVYDLLNEFSSLYEDVVSEDPVKFADIESVMESERKCLRLYDKYWKISKESNLSIDPAEYMRSNLGYDFHSCMLNREALAAELSAHTDLLKPEYKRKMKLCKEIVAAMGEEPVQRSKLVNQAFSNANSKDEVTCCYQKLVKKGRITENKVGNYWFASLPKKEKRESNTTVS